MGYGLDFPNVVDLVGVLDEKSEVVLIVTGPDVWSGSVQERELLNQKLEAYVSFVQSGQLARSYPQTRGYSVHIQIDTTTELPGLPHLWIQRFAEIIARDYAIELDVTRI